VPKQTCVGFGTYANFLPGNTAVTYTDFLDSGMITELKKYVSDLRLAIINSWECYVDPSKKDPETEPGTFDFTNLGSYPPCFFDLGGKYIHPTNFG
jgi:hypothetical protein